MLSACFFSSNWWNFGTQRLGERCCQRLQRFDPANQFDPNAHLPLAESFARRASPCRPQVCSTTRRPPILTASNKKRALGKGVSLGKELLGGSKSQFQASLVASTGLRDWTCLRVLGLGDSLVQQKSIVLTPFLFLSSCM